MRWERLRLRRSSLPMSSRHATWMRIRLLPRRSILPTSPWKVPPLVRAPPWGWLLLRYSALPLMLLPFRWGKYCLLELGSYLRMSGCLEAGLSWLDPCTAGQR